MLPIITMETPRTVSSLWGVWMCSEPFHNLHSIWFALFLLSFFFVRFSQHGVSISWLQRFRLRCFLQLSQINVQCEVFFFFFLASFPTAVITFWNVSLTTGRNHVQLLGDSSFEFSPWSPGECTKLCFSLPLLFASVFTLLHHVGGRGRRVEELFWHAAQCVAPCEACLMFIFLL